MYFARQQTKNYQQKFSQIPAASGNLATFCGTSSLHCICHSSPVETGDVSAHRPSKHLVLVAIHHEVLCNNT